VNSAWIEPWSRRWSALGERDRSALLALGAFLGAALFYLMVWSPVQAGLAQARAHLSEVQGQLARVREQAAQVEKARSLPRIAAPADLAAAVEQSAERHGLRDRLKRIDADGARGVRVQLEGAPYSALVAWLLELQQQRGLRAESAALERQANPGTVSARLLLRAPGA
jgi:general secretion pathway protein M